MTTQYRLESLTSEEGAPWCELIRPNVGLDLFHRGVWLDYLAASRGVEIRIWAIRDAGRTVGYFPGGLVRKGPFRVLGSPLKGWNTNFMGPVSDGTLDWDRFLVALDGLAGQEGLAMVEIESRSLSDISLLAAQYEAVPGWTYWVPLSPEKPDSMWQALDSTCRNRIRKAMKAGLSVEDTDEPSVADEFYDQYLDLMRRKGLVPPYPREHARLLVEHLKKADLLFALRVRDSAGRVLATGLFPHDDRTVYFWGGASWQEGRESCPNEFLHWNAMLLAASRGLTRYDMCGYGRFKSKFGGTLVTLKRWHKCHWRSARWARRGYQFYFQKRLRLHAWWQNLRVLRGGPALPGTD
jgi:hypothetical protein